MVTRVASRFNGDVNEDPITMAETIKQRLRRLAATLFRRPTGRTLYHRSADGVVTGRFLLGQRDGRIT